MKKKEDTLGFLLARTSNSMATLLNSLLKKQGIDLPHSQFIILKELYNEDGMSQQELAEKIFKDTSAIKRTLDILEKKELIKRVPVTQRRNSIKITEKGKELMPKVFKHIENSNQSILNGVSEEEYNVFINTLN